MSSDNPKLSECLTGLKWLRRMVSITRQGLFLTRTSGSASFSIWSILLCNVSLFLPDLTNHLDWLPVSAVSAHSTAQHSCSDRLKRHVVQIGSMWIALWIVLTVDFLLGCCVATICTLGYYYLNDEIAVNMSWNIVSLAVIFPISQGISMSFKRRYSAPHSLGLCHSL